MSTFDDRENAIKAKFAHDQEQEFRAEMMALRQIAVWGVSLMQISPEEKNTVQPPYNHSRCKKVPGR